MENSPCITIRLMNTEDAKQVAHIEKQSFSQPWPEEEFRKAATNKAYIYIVATHNERIVGYAGVIASAEEADITNIAVDAEYRRLGIADQLLKQLSRQLFQKDIKDIFLEVRESNSAAIALYSKNGFVKIGMRKNYYKLPNEDAIIMKFSFGTAYGENNA